MALGACAQKKNYAPVRSYHRDLANGQKYYVVRPGDTLYSVGFRSRHDYRQLAAWNRITPPYNIKVGQRIQLFKPVSKGERPVYASRYQKSVKKKRTASQKTPIISNINKKVLKLYWQWPVQGGILRNFYQTGKKGIDIFGNYGQSVTAAASGKVVYSGNGLIGYGNLLIIKHNELFLSAYANNRRLLVEEGQHVKKGQVIAELGRAKDKKTSLHFEIRKNGKPVNPVFYLPKK